MITDKRSILKQLLTGQIGKDSFRTMLIAASMPKVFIYTPDTLAGIEAKLDKAMTGGTVFLLPDNGRK